MTPSTVTCRSSMDSSRADWVFGGVRLISSPRTMLAKIGPGRNSKLAFVTSNTFTPVTSEGSRSEVNWIRRWWHDTEAESALPRLVLPTPGTSSTSRWPPATRHVTASRMASSLPWTTRAMLATRLSNSSAAREASSSTRRLAPAICPRASSPTWVRSMPVTSELERGRRSDHPRIWDRAARGRRSCPTSSSPLPLSRRPNIRRRRRRVPRGRPGSLKQGPPTRDRAEAHGSGRSRALVPVRGRGRALSGG